MVKARGVGGVAVVVCGWMEGNNQPLLLLGRRLTTRTSASSGLE